MIVKSKTMTTKRAEFWKKISINSNSIEVVGLGRIGMFSPYDQAILLDYSMKWIVGTNDKIPCSSQIKDKICDLFLDNQKIIRS
jgi:hypothetical protein